MNDIDELLTEIDALSKVEVVIWYRNNKMKLVALIIDMPDVDIEIEKVAQRIGSGIKGQVKQELKSLCRLEKEKRKKQENKDTLNIDIAAAHTSKKGDLIADYHNLFLIGETEFWDKIRFDYFSGTAHMRKPLPWSKDNFEPRAYQDIDTTEAVAWYNQFKITPSYNDVGHVLFALSMRNSYDAYQEWMDSKPKWDGKRRLNTWLFRYCGSWSDDQHERRVIAAYGRKLFISMVARCYDPGCMARLVFIFSGSQNIMKTLLIEAIGDPFYVSMTGKNLDLSKSDAHSVLNGTAIVEIPENILAKKNDAETLKAYFSTKVSKVRLPYGHHHVELKRRCVFTVSVNPGADNVHFNDPTGDSRYCLIECGVGKPLDWKIDLEGFKLVRDQLLAEAIHCYKNGEKWWLNPQQEQWQREQVDTHKVVNPAEYFVLKYLAVDPVYKDQGVYLDFLISILNVMDSCPKFSRQVVAEALKNMGFEQDRFTLTEREKNAVTSTTRQVRIWYLKGTKYHIIGNRTDDVSVFHRVLTETFRV